MVILYSKQSLYDTSIYRVMVANVIFKSCIDPHQYEIVLQLNIIFNKNIMRRPINPDYR